MKISPRDVSMDSADIPDQAIIKDLIFLEDFGHGLVPWSTAASVVFRVRQIHRANPESSEAAIGILIASVNNGSHASRIVAPHALKVSPLAQGARRSGNGLPYIATGSGNLDKLSC